MNLVYPEQSEVKYEKIKYPDGQISVVLLDNEIDAPVHLLGRFNSYEDLFLILAANDACKTICNEIHLTLPYVFGSRSDRRFKSNQSFDLKIICDIINRCKFKSITLLDPHSDVLPALLSTDDTNVYVINQLTWILDAISEFNIDMRDGILVSPDAGAYKKIFKIGEYLNKPIITANKYRNTDGDITLEVYGDVKDKHCFIIDDICDGGYTFVTLAKKLKELGASQVDLFVTHGIFSKGKLDYVDKIYTTNSIRDYDLSESIQLKNRLNILWN